MRRLMGLSAAVLLAAAGLAGAQQPVSMRITAPELTGVTDWIHTKPLTLKDLKGQVVVLHFWTFG